MANGHQPLVSSMSIRTSPPVTATDSIRPMSTTLMPFSRQHGSKHWRSAPKTSASVGGAYVALVF